jgi:hypothetical protein
MTRKIFIIYIIFSSIIAYIAVLTKGIQIQYNYEYEFDTSDLTQPLLYILLAGVCFIVGYGTNAKIKNIYKISKDYNQIKLAINSKILVVFIVIQIAIVCYILVKLMIAVNNADDFRYLHYRPLSDKSTSILLLIQAIMPIIFSRNYVLKNISIFLCIVIGFMFAWIDASRSGILCMAGLLVLTLMQKKYFQILCYSSIILFYFVIAMIGREYNNRLNVDIFFMVMGAVRDNFYEATMSVLSYFTAFSILQFSYVVQNNSGSFYFNDLLYAITPLPSFLWPTIPNYDAWRVDIYRPMGAASELLRVSIFAFGLFFYIFGYLGKKIDSMTNASLKLLAVCIFSMSCVLIFQYNLRSVEWFIYLLLVMCFIDKTMLSRHQKQAEF